MRTTETFHRGERALQSRVGVRDKLAELGQRVVRDHLPEQHQRFYERLPFIVYGAVDDTGQPWASLLTGKPGFVSVEDARNLKIAANPSPRDPLHTALSVGSDVGLLGMEFATSRRNRVNGRITALDESGLSLNVHQSFGNCPKYIQKRSVSGEDGLRSEPKPAHTSHLTKYQRQWIHNADTFFIASQFSEGNNDVNEGVDVSHRGGRPGFVFSEDSHTLIWPDFSGNRHFNTFGNLHLNPRAGLLFVNFETGDLLYVAGTTEILWEDPLINNFAGAERMVRFITSQVIEVPSAIPLRWSEPIQSPFLSATGIWSN